ncbi:MAG: phage major capsid protein [Oscillospiraceae bacterium]
MTWSCYISREFARRIGAKEEEAFFTGDGSGKPAGIFAATGGAETGVTAASPPPPSPPMS